MITKLKNLKIIIFNYVKDHDGGYIGFWNDEERSETRYLMRIAEFSESSSFRTQLAIIGYPFDCAFLTCTHLNTGGELRSAGRDFPCLY